MELLVKILAGIGSGIAVLLLFGITVMLHELGHFIAARKLGLVADVFSIGFGPVLWKKKKNGVTYKICAIPFGGYVSIPQLDPSGVALVQGTNADGTERRLPPSKWWKNIIVAAAGPFGDIVFALALALIISLFPPFNPVPGIDLSSAIIGDVEKGSGAYAAGLRAGDHVLNVAGREVRNWEKFITECHIASGSDSGAVSLYVSNRVDGAVRTIDAPVELNKTKSFYRIAGIYPLTLSAATDIAADSPAAEAGIQINDVFVAVNGKTLYTPVFNEVQKAKDRPLALTVMRGKKFHDITLTPKFNEEFELPDGSKGAYLIGVTLQPVSLQTRSWMAHRNPITQLKDDASSIFRILDALVTPKERGERGRVFSALGGPVIILTSLWMKLQSGLLAVLAFLRFLNVNLAILNLLPIPVLDGGHIMFALWEGVARRKPNARFVEVVTNFFAVLFILFFCFMVWRDSNLLYRLFGKESKEPDAIEEVRHASSGPDDAGPAMPAEPEAIGGEAADENANAGKDRGGPASMGGAESEGATGGDAE